MSTASRLVFLMLALAACGPSRGSDTGEGSGESGETLSSMSDGSETDGGEASGFRVELDLSSVSECDPFAQDCPEGEKCVAYSSTGGIWNANKCVPVLGDQAPGEPCTWTGIDEATDDCDETSACWEVENVDGELVGVCRLFCSGSSSAPECPPSTLCHTDRAGTINFCIPTCDPLIQDCNAGLGCYWNEDDFEFQCIFTTQDFPAGEPCGFVNDCAPGHLCREAALSPNCAGERCCLPFCDLELGDAACEAQLPGTVCVPFFDQGMALPGYEQLGLCVVAP
jgi:hypothetical protein